MSVVIKIDLSDTVAEEMHGLRTRLANRAHIHAAMAGAGERLVKDFGVRTSEGEHRTANRLGARPTGHLAKAYQDIESRSDDQSASLLVPRASRLRAAFGAYTVRPGPGKKFLTIPVAAEAYGKRAGEISGLVPMRVGPKKTPILARPNPDGTITTYYLLAREANIPADEGLIPFDDLSTEAADAAELYILTGETS